MSVRKPARFPATLPQAPAGGAPSTASAATMAARDVQRPQRLLQDAARDAARLIPSSGLGMDSAAVRQRMVQRLREVGVEDERVLAAVAAVARHQFVDTALATQAYEDTSLPIGWGQTISKPSVVARMLALLCQRSGAPLTKPLGSVLEIGTGCGYQAALLAQLARRVVSIERLRPLHDAARARLEDLRGHHVRLVFGDGMLGHAPQAPYDTIIAAAGGEAIPQAWLEQLAEGGRLVAPMHDEASGGQRLVMVDKCDGHYTRSLLDAVHFVPLKSGTQ